MVTHLATAPGSGPEFSKETALLPAPLAIIDSQGATLTEEEVKSLVWRSSLTGEVTPAPSPEVPLIDLYYRPERTPSQPVRTESEDD